jgi:hypothetical protein
MNASVDINCSDDADCRGGLLDVLIVVMHPLTVVVVDVMIVCYVLLH